MFGLKTRFHICDLFGIPLYLDLTTIFIMLMFLQCGDIVLAIGLSLILAVSIVAHELGHSLTARCFGCRTTNITLTVIGGCASMERIPRKGWQEFLVAAAGPAVSFALGFTLYVTALFLGGGIGRAAAQLRADLRDIGILQLRKRGWSLDTERLRLAKDVAAREFQGFG